MTVVEISGYESTIEGLDAQYAALIKKVEQGEIPTMQDLPRISSDVNISQREKEAIFKRQHGFEFHGMQSARLNTMLDGFHGHTALFPPDYKERGITYREFERGLHDRISMSSTYGDILLIRENADETIKGHEQRSETFPITDMFLPPTTNPDLLPEWIKQIIQPRLTIIDTGYPSTGGIAKAYKRIEKIKNQVWAYIGWLQK